MLPDTTKSKANLAIPTNLKAIILHRFQSIASALTPSRAAYSSLIMALPFAQARSGSPPADDVPGVTNPLSGRSDAPANSPTGQPSLTVELPAGSAEEPLSGEALLRQAHQIFHKAQQSLATAYAQQGLAVPSGLRVKHRQPKAAAARTARDTPLRVSAAAGAKEPSPAYSSSLSVRINPYAEGGASKRSAARGYC